MTYDQLYMSLEMLHIFTNNGQTVLPVPSMLNVATLSLLLQLPRAGPG